MATKAVKTKYQTVMDPTALNVAEMYAQATLENCPDVAACEDFYNQLQSLVAVLDEHVQFEELMTASLLSHREKLSLVLRAFDGRVDERLAGLIAVLAKHGRLSLLRSIAGQFRKLLDVKEGKIEVSITTAVPMDSDQLKRIKDELSAKLGSEVVLTTAENADLLGGLVLRVADRVYDASVRKDLERIRRKMLKK